MDVGRLSGCLSYGSQPEGRCIDDGLYVLPVICCKRNNGEYLSEKMKAASEDAAFVRLEICFFIYFSF